MCNWHKNIYRLCRQSNEADTGFSILFGLIYKYNVVWVKGNKRL